METPLFCDDIPSVNRLIGNPVEAFYQLGEICHEEVKIFRDQLFNSVNSSINSKYILKIGQNLTKNALNDEFFTLLKAFAKGAQLSSDDIIAMTLVPELANIHKKLAANLLSYIPGCTTVLEWDAKNKTTVHTRVLDFPIAGAMQLKTNLYCLEIPNKNKIFYNAFQSFAFPISMLTNDAGISVSIHNKFSDYLNYSGESIYSIVFQVMLEARSLKDVKRILRDKISLTRWGLVFSDNEGNALHIDLSGHEKYKQEFSLFDQKHLVITNHPVSMDPATLKAQPFNYINTCNDRKRLLEQELEHNDNKKIKIKHFDSLYNASNKTHSDQWYTPPINTSTVAIVSVQNNLKEYSILHNKDFPTKAEVFDLSDFFNTRELAAKEHIFELSWGSTYQHMVKAQGLWDKQDYPSAYYHLQMAIEVCSDEYLKSQLEFFFIYWQSILDQNKDHLKINFNKLINLCSKLSPVMRDHCYILIQRIQKITQLAPIDYRDQFSNQELKQRYLKEMKVKKFVIKIMLKLSFPRLEIPDIIYQS